MIISEKYLSYHLIVTCLWMYSMIFGRFQSFLSGEGNGNPLQYSCLENPTDGGAWWAAVHGVANSRTQLSDFIFTFLHWRRKWQPTPVFLPGESQGRGSMVGCRLWGHTESDATEATWQQPQQQQSFFLRLSIDRMRTPPPMLRRVICFTHSLIKMYVCSVMSNSL